jgi:hypothetical protein
VNGGALVEAHPVDRALNAEMKRLWNSQPYNGKVSGAAAGD